MADTYLTSLFKDKDRVKALGARWDAERRQWYVPDGRDLTPFATWLPATSAPTTRKVSSPAVASDETAVSVQAKGISLAQLMAGVAQAVARSYPSAVWARVEVINVRANRGTVYLELAERDRDGTTVAQARGMIWASTADEIIPAFERATGVVLGGGIKLLVRAKPAMHTNYGLSLVIEAIDPEYTLGDLEARKREIRARLQREGLFELNRKLAAPWDYRSVIVLAPQGAAGLGDFQAEAMRLERRGICQFVYVDSRFQGEGAAAEMRIALVDGLQSWALEHGHPPDAVAIIRGGGAVNDLAWLNDYDLARCICELRVPVLTGIGHERDNTLLDEVAHLRFDTPSKVIAGIEQTIVGRVREAKAAYESVTRFAGQAARLFGRNVDRLDALIKTRARQSAVVIRTGAGELLAQTRHLARAGLGSARSAASKQFASVRTDALGRVQDGRQVLPALLAEVKSEARRTVRQAGSTTRAILGSSGERIAQSARHTRSVANDAMAETGNSARRLVQSSAGKAEALMREISGQGPERTLRRGFAIALGPERKAVTSAAAARAALKMTLEFHDGKVSAITVDEEDRG